MPAGRRSLTIMYQCMKRIVNEQEPLYNKSPFHLIPFYVDKISFVFFFKVDFVLHITRI